MGGMFERRGWCPDWRRNQPRMAGIGTMLLIGLTVAGCGTRAVSDPATGGVPVQTTAIADLPVDPSASAIVYVKGTVGNPVPLLEGTVYPLQDSTGKVWILTREPAPKPGEAVTVKGTIRYKPISIDGKEQGAIYLEQE